MKEFKYVVTDAEGIHARPAGLLVKKAGEFTSSVTIAKGDKCIWWSVHRKTFFL